MNTKHHEHWQSTPRKKHIKAFHNETSATRTKKIIVEGEQKPVEASNRTVNRSVSHEGTNK
jgi:hypothetical protein